jgi:hypothetical protein
MTQSEEMAPVRGKSDGALRRSSGLFCLLCAHQDQRMTRYSLV